MGTTIYVHQSAGNPDVRVFRFRPSTIDENTRLISVHHGTARNASGALNNWTTWAGANNYIVVAPEFTEANWPTAAYNRGNMIGPTGALNPESKWSFTLARDIALNAMAAFGLASNTYDIQGHSAGAQFTHRMMAFRPESIRYAFPCNAGVYTAPSMSINYYYGLKSSVIGYTSQKLTDWTNRNMLIFRGELDIYQDEDLSTTSGAMAQGPNRFERAGYMYQKGAEANPDTAWELHNVPNVGHDSTGMAAAVQAHILTLSEPPPEPDPVPLAHGRRVKTTAVTDIRNKLIGGGAKILGTQPAGALGTITGGPRSSSGVLYWSVNFDLGKDGWAAEDHLAIA